jgi:predicted dehydrogenase
MLEQAIHFFDLARWYMARRGEPATLFACTVGQTEGLQENMGVVLTFPGGAYALISQIAAGAGHHQLAEVVGSDASLRVVWSGESDQSTEATFRLELARDDAAEELLVVGSVSEEASLRSEIASVISSVRSGAAPFADGRDGRWAVRLCLAAEQSASVRQEVPV